MIDKQTQDRAWRCAPKAFRDAVKYEYNHTIYSHVRDILNYFFDRHNLTSDTEPEEMVCVSRAKVMGVYAYNDDILRLDPTHNGAKLLKAKLQELFGSKCLPDDPLQTSVKVEAPSVKVEESKAEPKFKVGDKVIYKMTGKIKVVGEILPDGRYYVTLPNKQSPLWLDESYLETYTEPTQNNDNMEEKELNLKEIVDSNFYCGYKECRRNGEGNLPPLKCDKVLCCARVMKPKRWRAKEGETFWWIGCDGGIEEDTEHFQIGDDGCYAHGNYFRTKELAKQAAEAERECLMKFHEQHNQQ